jgi:multicomponent Na+:H+ antiporter subunit E
MGGSGHSVVPGRPRDPFAGVTPLSVLRLTLLYTFSWWVLADGDASSWTLGVPAIGLALLVTHVVRSEPPAPDTATETAAAPPVRFRLRALPAFAAFFVSRSVLAGVDVARRTLAPSLPLAPAERTLTTDLPAGLPRVLLVATLSLMPGSLGLSLEEDVVTLHLLDDTHDMLADVRATERRIAALFAPAASRGAAAPDAAGPA